MEKELMNQVFKATEAFKAIKELIKLNGIELDTEKYECRVLPELWTAWVLSEDTSQIDNITRNIMMYCDSVASKLVGDKVMGAYKSDVYFHALDKDNNYYLGKFNRTEGLLLP